MIKITTFEDSVEIFNQQGCIGRQLFTSPALELVYLTVGANSGVAKHALPYPVIFHVQEGCGTLITENESFTVTQGAMIECPPHVQRSWENASSTDLKLLVIKCIGENEDAIA